MKLRLALAMTILFTFSASTASALPFTVEFAVTWSEASDLTQMGTGAIIGLTVDNGALSPLNQSYLFDDVRSIGVDARPFGGTYNTTFGVYIVDHCCVETLFTISDSGQAVLADAATFYSAPPTGSLSQYSFRHTLNFALGADLIRFGDFGPCPQSSCGGISARALVPNGQLVGSVPDTTGTFTSLGLALMGVVAAHRRSHTRAWRAPSD